MDVLRKMKTNGKCPANFAIADPARDSLGATTEHATQFRYTYESDINFMKQNGIKHFRMSLSWSRIFPTGFKADGHSESGVKFYQDVFDKLIANGITPLVTLYHWDLPQGLLNAPGPIELLRELACHEETLGYYQGWFSATKAEGGKIIPRGTDAVTVKEFANYADFCFKTFPQVKNWSTFNEAWVASKLSSGWGKAPSTAPFMDVKIWPYVAAHNMIVAHALAAKTVLENYPDLQFSIVNNCDYQHPIDENDPENVAKANSLIDDWLGWFMHPIYGTPDGNGRFVHDYPQTMKPPHSGKVYFPEFTVAEKDLLQKGRAALKAIGLNHYGTILVDANGNTSDGTASKMFDNKVPISFSFKNKGIPTAESGWLNMAGWGLRKLLNWIQNTYQPNLPIYVTENGCSDASNRGSQGFYDPARVMYYHDYLSELHKAINEDKINVKGYYAWSLFDNYEWEMGYREMFGIVYNDIEYIRNQEEIDNHNKNTKSPLIGEEHPLLYFPSDDAMEVKSQFVHRMIKIPTSTGLKVAKRSFLFLKDSCFGDNRTLADPLKYVSLNQIKEYPYDSISYVPEFKRP